jgi:hypothetical protein
MEDIKKYSIILDSRFTKTINNLEEKSKIELEDIKNLKDKINKMQGKIKKKY